MIIATAQLTKVCKTFVFQVCTSFRSVLTVCPGTQHRQMDMQACPPDSWLAEINVRMTSALYRMQ